MASARLIATLCVLGASSHGAVLPDDRGDALYHRYDGGGVLIQGPSILIRKKIGNSTSLAYNYYVDAISGASIDVVTQASPYKERRTQHSLSADFLHGKTTYSGGYITSRENDYRAKTGYLSVSQDMFGDLTTISFGYTFGQDTVGRRGDADFAQPITRRNWQVGLTQVLTRNLLLGGNFETIESEGFLNNPYRQVRYREGNARGYDWQPERYPHTHTGNAGSLKLKYYLPWRAALEGSYRLYSDTWGILAHTGKLSYTQPAFGNWIFEGRVRYYTQTKADFYSDLFDFRDQYNFLARDRELAAFRSLTLGAVVSREFRISRPAFLQKGTINFSWDRLHFAYDNFRDARITDVGAGSEPLYTLDANVMQFFISVWY